METINESNKLQEPNKGVVVLCIVGIFVLSVGLGILS